LRQALTHLGEKLRTARIRRNFTIDEVAQKIGTGRRAVMDAERGKPSSGVGVYVALLWVYDLLSQLSCSIGAPARSID
jgi:transcriptional regulator with XRE-family HTH domain